MICLSCCSVITLADFLGLLRCERDLSESMNVHSKQEKCMNHSSFELLIGIHLCNFQKQTM
jgi:hypothetical protein